jgi:hypothetical protein
MLRTHVSKSVLFVSLALAAAGAALSCSDQSSTPTAPGNQPSLARGGAQGPDLSAAIAAQQRATDRLLASEAVVGTAVGLTADGRPAVKIYTVRQGVGGLPSQLDGIPVEVEVTGEISAIGPTAVPAHPSRGKPPAPTVDPTGFFTRPVPIGVSTGNQNDLLYYKRFCTSGTLGARLKGGNGNYYALSNNHVYAVENLGQIGDPVIQPGQADLGCRAPDSDRIGTLAYYVPLQFGGKNSNTVDAAIASVTTGEVGVGTPSDGYGTPSSTTSTATVGLAVEKYGRTTGDTKGTVTAINATLKVKYSRGTAIFTNQVGIGPGNFSGAGDSGSLIVTQSGDNPVGLLFAGSSTTTFANPIGAVLSQLGSAAGTSLTVDNGH